MAPSVFAKDSICGETGRCRIGGEGDFGERGPEIFSQDRRNGLFAIEGDLSECSCVLVYISFRIPI